MDPSRWPIAERSMRLLLARIERLAGHLPTQCVEDQRMLSRLRAHASSVAIVFDSAVAAIGRCVTMDIDDGHVESFWLALPGEEETTAATVSVASPLGRAIAGARIGDTVHLIHRGSSRCGVVLRVT
jgi:transcription elongation GreA/GreB family factor